MDSEQKTTVSMEAREVNSPPANVEKVRLPSDGGAPSVAAAGTELAFTADGRLHSPKKKKKPATTNKCSGKHGKKKTKKSKKHDLVDDDSSSASEIDSESESEDIGIKSLSSSDDDSTDSEPDQEDSASKKKRVSKKRHQSPKSKSKKKKLDRENGRAKKSKKSAKDKSISWAASSGSGSDSDSDDSESEDSSDTSICDDDDDDDDDEAEGNNKLAQQDLAKQIVQLQIQQHRLQQQLDQQLPREPSFHNTLGGLLPGMQLDPPTPADRVRARQALRVTRAGRNGNIGDLGRLGFGGLEPNRILGGKKGKAVPGRHHGKPSTRLEFKRVDHVWDNAIHQYKLQDTAQNTNDKHYDEFIFHVRRTFDWEGKYKTTIVDVKSKLLREALQAVMGNIKGVSLVDDTPKLDPNMLFLHLEDLRKHIKDLKKTKPTGGNKRERKKDQKRIDEKRQHIKVLIKYIDKDYAKVKESLYPMLKNGLITFDLLWALWKPNTLAFTTTYGSHDEPRVFRVDIADKHYSLIKGDFYFLEGKYFEYDGKQFGYGAISEEIREFRGARKITSLPIYPLQYHKTETQIREKLIERGKKFVALGGVHYKCHQGMAYLKKKNNIVKVNINGRIMVDPAIHRRINPNYPVTIVKPKDHNVASDDENSEDESDRCDCASDSDKAKGSDDEKVKVKYVAKLVKDKNGKQQLVWLPKNEADELNRERLDQVPIRDEGAAQETEEEAIAKKGHEFSDEEYLIASPVVLGFAFAEKLWLEFTVSGVAEIQWNESAYESLVLEKKTKDIIKALVESHKYHPTQSIDDVIQGKGKGLVAVLHGPPGTGKTLTAEGISEFLKCPLYMVSAGELGTDSRFLEAELQKILDICHAWGAILLLDEADVFMEKRTIRDIHRNALVSIFLRQLEYFQGILFLTTNRVETFDDAFQSRIHIALRYDELEHRAKKTIFQIFINRVRELEKADVVPFSDEDLSLLARYSLNGRQIKNTITAAQALAVMSGKSMSMEHIHQVLEVQMRFEQDLKGGTGYHDAMRSYL